MGGYGLINHIFFIFFILVLFLISYFYDLVGNGIYLISKYRNLILSPIELQSK